MAKIDVLYHQLLNAIVDKGYWYEDTSRNVRCRQLSSLTLEIPLTDSFPVLTTKEMYTKGIIGELLWFLKGKSSIHYLLDNDINIWNKDAYNYYVNTCREQGHEPILEYSVWLEQVKNKEMFPDDEYKFTDGEIGRGYGQQWRKWKASKPNDYTVEDHERPYYMDQISSLLRNMIQHPMSRRHIVTAWNPAEINDTALPPCHWSFEIIVKPLNTQELISLSGKDIVYMESLWNNAYLKKNEEAKRILDEELEGLPTYGFTLKWHQRSVDTFLGLPFNITSYAFLAKIIEMLTGYTALSIIADLSNVHIYENHLGVIQEQLQRNPTTHPDAQFGASVEFVELSNLFKTGQIDFDKVIEFLDVGDFVLVGYKSFGKLKAEMLAKNIK